MIDKIKKENLTNLINLTNASKFSDIIASVSDTISEMKVICGKLVLEGIINISQISIARCFATGKTELEEHFHDQLEILIIYEGLMILHDDNKEYILKPGSLRYILPNSIHSATFPNDSKIIAITMPQSTDFPKGVLNV